MTLHRLELVGIYHHLLVDRHDVALAVALSATYTHDCKLLEPLLDAVRQDAAKLGSPAVWILVTNSEAARQLAEAT